MSFSRKAMAVAAAGTLVLSLAACNRDTGSTGTDTESGAANGDGATVTLAVSTLNNPFFIELRDGAQEAADAAGVELVVLDAQDDPATQQNQVADAATGDMKALIINPVDSAAAGPAVAPVISADIPVIAVDRAVEGAEVDSNVSSDNVAGGKLAADQMAKAIGEKGKIIVLEGVPGASASRDRGQGFTEGIAAYPDIEVVASQTANFNRAEGLDVATNLLQSNPDVVGIFAQNDEMALGAIQALGDRAGKDVFVVGFDGTDEGMTAIEAGTLYASVAQQPAELGKRAVEIALAAINGETVEKDAPVEVVIINAENVSEHK